jgi:hypothetical protein
MSFHALTDKPNITYLLKGAALLLTIFLRTNTIVLLLRLKQAIKCMVQRVQYAVVTTEFDMFVTCEKKIYPKTFPSLRPKQYILPAPIQRTLRRS